MERFDLDFHILTPGGQAHIYSLVDGKVVLAPVPETAPQTPELAEIAGQE